MTSDYPDWTDLVQLVGVDVMLPVDIQAQYVTLEMDIVAQSVGDITIDIAAQSVGNIDVSLAASAITLDVNLKSQTANIDVNLAASAITLDVNLKSQTANINVNLAASAITLDVDIKAQTVGDITIDIEAQSVGVHIQSEWAVKEGDTKILRASGTNKAYGANVSASHTVPAGKAWYISYFTGGCVANAAADGDKEQMCIGYIWDVTAGVYYAYIGGNGGFSASFSAPIRIDANHQVYIYIVNCANHNTKLYVNAGGYEV